MTEVRLSVPALEDLGVRILTRHGVSAANAAAVTRALVAAEIDGKKGHGASRLPSYAAQAASGKVDGGAVPTCARVGAAGLRIDAGHGFAYPALELAIEELGALAPRSAVAAAAVTRSHHFGQAGYHVEALAGKGLIGLVFGNSPKAIAPWGGRDGIFGTNPIAFAAPRTGAAPLVIDLSMSKVARGKIMVAAKEGKPIPEGWALDAEGRPTTDAEAAMAGTMVPLGEAKGAALAVMVEVLAAALTGANLGFEASSFFSAEGPPPGVGQFLLAFDPAAFSGGGFAERLETLLAAMLAQDGVRLPGSRRLEARARAEREGLALPAGLHRELQALAGES
ncbi:MAG: Ldh family oxidoreductase [Kiloniellales bacterium]|nr:Ldh family oxidoreductase [Kiloniellales bacterium]